MAIPSTIFPTLPQNQKLGARLQNGVLGPPITATAPLPQPLPAPAQPDQNPDLTRFFAGMVPATAENSTWPGGAPMSNPAAGTVSQQMPGNLFVNPAQPGAFFIKSNNGTGFWSFDPTQKTSAAPITMAPSPQPAALPPVNLPSAAPTLPPLPPLPPQAPITQPPAMGGGLPPVGGGLGAAGGFDPIAFLNQLQTQTTPMANAVAGPAAGPVPMEPGIPSPMAPPTQMPTPPIIPPGTQTAPGPTQSMGQSIGQAPTAATPGLASGGGDAGGSVSPVLTPPTDEIGQLGSPIPFNPNTPSPAGSTLGPNASIEDFLGSLGGLQFGAQGILGVPGGPQRAAGQSEADFTRALIAQGLLRGARPIAL